MGRLQWGIFESNNRIPRNRRHRRTHTSCPRPMARSRPTSPSTHRSLGRCSPHPDKYAPKYNLNPCAALQGPASPPNARPIRTVPSCCNCWGTIVARRPTPRTGQIRTRTPPSRDRSAPGWSIPPTHGPYRRPWRRPPTRVPGDSSAGSSRRPSTRRSTRRQNTAPCSARCRCTCRGRGCRRPLLLPTIRAGRCCSTHRTRNSRDHGRADGRPRHLGTTRQRPERGTSERADRVVMTWFFKPSN